ncbi:MAG: hypothetical protein LBK83_09995 [Treponema sp.]|jgi:hypothetical protein|nr:hypothetical protein [Treponema sp.]
MNIFLSEAVPELQFLEQAQVFDLFSYCKTITWKKARKIKGFTKKSFKNFIDYYEKPGYNSQYPVWKNQNVLSLERERTLHLLFLD